MPAIHTTYGNFQSEILASKEPVLLYFWHPLSHHSMGIKSMIEEYRLTYRPASKALHTNVFTVRYSDKYQGRAKIALANADEVGALSAQYNVVVLPHLVMLKNGAEVESDRGMIPPERACQMIDAALA